MKMNVLFRRDERFPIGNLSRIEIVRTRPSAKVVTVMGSKEHFCCFNDMYSLRVLGEKVFWQKVGKSCLTYKDGRFYGDIEPFKGVICQVFNLNWLTDHKWIYQLLGSKKDLWKSVIQGKITNPEILCKKYSKKYFKGVYSYKNIRAFAEYTPNISLWDLYYYCTNPDLGLQYLIAERKKYLDHGWEFLESQDEITESDIRDFMQYCEMLGNSKWNPKWSKKRFIEEHQEQIRKIHLAEIEEKPDTLIAEPYSKGGLSLILDERSCFEEGMKMHNCVHTCYWQKIISGSYIIAKGTVNGEYIDLGIHIGTVPHIDQVHTIRNGDVSKGVMAKCTQWVDENKDALLNTSNAIRGNKALEEYTTIPF